MSFKYDLIRNYVLELIHYGQKLQPASKISASNDASMRVVSLFIELLERQFPIESWEQRLQLKTAKRLCGPIGCSCQLFKQKIKGKHWKDNHRIYFGPIIQEAKNTFKTDKMECFRNILRPGFEEIAHFSNF